MKKKKLPGTRFTQAHTNTHTHTNALSDARKAAAKRNGRVVVQPQRQGRERAIERQRTTKEGMQCVS